MPIHLALLGGALIGLSVTLMLLFNGRVTGISGILNQTFSEEFRSPWRILFLFGLLCGGLIIFLSEPSLFHNRSTRDFLQLICAGFLVGLGATLAGGCTSGHGICGVSRISLRSIMATSIFLLSALATVSVLRFLRWIL